MSDWLLPLALAFIMFSLGLGLQAIDFLRVVREPRAMAVGLLAQMLVLPALAFLLLGVFGVSGELAVGVMILAACPGGVSAGLLTRLAGGETALSISLTAVSSVAILFSLPLVVGFAVAHFAGSQTELALPLGRTLGSVLLVTVLPVLLGMFFRHWRPLTVARLEPGFTRGATILFVVIVGLTFFQNHGLIMAQLPALGPLLFLLNGLVMGLGLLLGRLFAVSARGQVALAMECGLQNAALGIFVALSLLQQPALAAPSVVYAFLMNLTALAWVLKRRCA